MKLIVCVSDKMGVAFNRRRQSRDAILCEDLLEMISGQRLLVHPNSAALFGEASCICESENYLTEAEADDWCFYEGIGEIPMDKVDVLVLYHWNRDYPADVFFRMPKGYTLESSAHLNGKSHPDILKEIWVHEK